MSSSSTNESTSAFARHSLDEQNRQQQAASNANNSNGESTVHPLGQMSLTARLMIFIFVPTFTGLMGLLVSYLETFHVPSPDEKDQRGNPMKQHEVDFDRDFLNPFLLSMALVVVLGFQTRGYSTKERQYFLQWPKARKVKKITRKRVVVDDDGNAVELHDGEGRKDEVSKKKE
mmetsp:Transcript_17487/g.36445  ORF Transcript_17487/g.36445 Transcript_17487/m.36445 type:complete len:174 (+) Transcript_17487:209-730(+)